MFSEAVHGPWRTDAIQAPGIIEFYDWYRHQRLARQFIVHEVYQRSGETGYVVASGWFVRKDGKPFQKKSIAGIKEKSLIRIISSPIKL